MNIHLTRDGQDFGPFEIEVINGYLQDGFLFATDLAWYEGLARWIPLSRVPGVQLPAIADQPPPMVQATVKPMPPPAVAPFVRQITDTGRNRPKVSLLPSAAQSVVSPSATQATQPAAAKPKMTLLKWCASVFIAIGFISFCNEGSNRQAVAPPPRNEEERQISQVFEALPAIIEAGQRYDQQEAQRQQQIRNQYEAAGRAADERTRKNNERVNEERARRADEVNRRLLGQ